MFVLVLIVRSTGGNVYSAFGKMHEFVIVTMTAVQSIVQVVRASGPGLPGFFVQLRSVFAAVQLKGVGVPAACSGSGLQPLMSDVLIQVGALFLTAVAACLTAGLWWRPPAGRAPALLGRVALAVCFFFMNLLYPIATNAAISVFPCSRLAMTVGQYLLLDQDGKTMRAAGLGEKDTLKILNVSGASPHAPP